MRQLDSFGGKCRCRATNNSIIDLLRTHWPAALRPDKLQLWLSAFVSTAPSRRGPRLSSRHLLIETDNQNCSLWGCPHGQFVRQCGVYCHCISSTTTALQIVVYLSVYHSSCHPERSMTFVMRSRRIHALTATFHVKSVRRSFDSAYAPLRMTDAATVR